MTHQDIAVIGMAGRFPGASTLDEYWANLRDGVSAIRALSDEELRAAGVSDAELADPAYVRMCPVLSGVGEFDAGFFGLSPRDASVMDPAHRLFLEVAWEAMENAGQTALPEDGAVGVFAGSGASYYLMDHVRRQPDLMRSMGEFLVRHTNNDMNFLATRVSYELDLRGPGINVQTACSSALVAVHLACESIRRGECAMAIAGGATVLIPDGQGYLYQEGEILSPDGRCRPFDANSAGTVFGSGGGCVVLKGLSAALDDGDTIHAVIRGSFVNNDGAMRAGFLAPGVEGQAEVVRRALDAAGVPAESVTYIETHGTGTSVGDPIEVAALNQAFHGRTARRQFCAIGSVKSNVGHLGEAAGIAALIKAILALTHRALPPSLGYETPNPRIEFREGPFFVNDRLRDWESVGPRRCGVTALGAGGTNCHLILEEAPERIPGEGARAAQLFVLSAETTTALQAAGENLADALEADIAPDLADAAYTLALGRRAMPERCALVARDHADAVAQLRAREPKRVAVQRAEERAGGAVFMFPGGGAQYAGMGRELHESEPIFRRAVEECVEVANARLGRDLRALMFADDATTGGATRELERPSLSLPALFTIEYAFAKVFESWGVDASAYVGHSMGEYVAACLAGVMALDDALELVMLRGRLFEAIPRGRMLSVPLSESALRALLPAELDIAAVNAAELCVASGPEASIEALESALAAQGIECTRIRIDVAAHSAMLEPVLPEFRAFCRGITLHPPRVPYLSNVSGRWITAEEATDPEYWVHHLRSTVRFADCLATLHADGERVLLEVGPGRALSSLARAQASPARHAFNAMRHRDETTSDVDHALLTLGRLWCAGVPVEWSAFYDGQLRNRVPLPTYAWDHARYWIDAPAGERAGEAPAPADDGRRENVDDWFARPEWRQSVPLAPLSPAEERVLLFCDEAGFGEAVAARLSDAGRRVTRVMQGPRWHRASADLVTMRPAAPGDYDALLTMLLADGSMPTRIVHCWGVTEQANGASVDAMLEQGFHSLLCLAQALGSHEADAHIALSVITSGLQSVGGEAQLEPAKALLLGPARVMQQELNVTTRTIDIVLPTAGARRAVLATRVAAEVASGTRDEVVAYRGNERYVQLLEPVQLSRVASRIKPRGIYLITGGLGGIGYALASHLATAHQARLVLIGRGATASRSARQIAELTALGAEVLVLQADVTDVARMHEVVAAARARFGGLDGVFHTAGVLDDALMALRTRGDAERVLAPKVHGTLALDHALGDAPLDLFVLFSSVSSVAGLAGQSDYTAANAFLDAFAAERSARTDSFTIAVNWSAWREVGMAARLAAGSDATPNDASHPLLGRRVWSGGGGELFTSALQVETHWVVGEHRLRGGACLMPGTGHLEVARAALTVAGDTRAVELNDVSFISALVVPDATTLEMRVKLSAPRDAMRGFVIASRGEEPAGLPVWHEHVTGRGGHVDAELPAPLDVAAIAARCTVREQRFPGGEESPHMDFGARWKNRERIRFGRDEALITLELPEQFAGDLESYPLHPALMDMATGGAVALLAGFDAARDFYVPLSYTRLRAFGALPQRIVSHVRVVPSEFGSSDIAVFDVTIADEAGRVLVAIEEFMMTRVTDVSQLQAGSARRSSASFEPPASSTLPPPLTRWMDDAIRPAEGMQALERIIAGPALSQLFVTPRPVPALLAEMRQPRERPAAVVGVPARPPQRIADAEGRLVMHAGVAQAVVLERFDRPGKRHVVAYVLPRDGERPTVSELRRFAKAALPAASVPGVILFVEALPPGTTGDVDLLALEDPFTLIDDFVPPRTTTETIIADIWKEALGLERVGVRDNFFDIGGHSLLAVRAIVRLDKSIGVRLTQSIMVMQTLELVAAETDRQLAAREQPAREAPHGFFTSLRSAVRGKPR